MMKLYVLGCRNVCCETVSECLYLFMCALQSFICVNVCGCVCLVCFSYRVLKLAKHPVKTFCKN